ncbi:SET domain-containing protein SmydA-8-like isoform X2 [Macrobrachium rosenbergii]|uniref:SET domain-containing protein SmydA-8-like isoform X2 n=1 Tax=Macrobrachium rosenbergii TaxID=79674 RepID=UPI0034D7235E
MESRICEVCRVPATQSCSSCHASFYCSRECQKKDWKSHRGSCIPYTIEVSPVYGRYPRATRDIEAGEIIMRDTALAVGPRNPLRSLCLGCHKAASGAHVCFKCLFPQCSATCENSASHEAECLVLSKLGGTCHVGTTNDVCEFILPLRCLLTKYTDPKKWKALNGLQDNLGSVTDEWKLRVRHNVIDYLNQVITFKDIEASDIYKICGIIQTNAFEMKMNGESIQAVFPKMSMLAHDCCPNAKSVCTGGMKAIVKSTVPIAKGAPITVNYTNHLWNTIRRRQDLLVKKSYDILSKAFEERDKSKIEPLEELIDLCSGRLHSNHQIPLEAKLAWVKFCGNHPDYRYRDLSKVQLQTKISFCRDLLKVADVISPGKSNFRGHILFELHATLKTMARKLQSFGDLNNERTDVYYDEAEDKLRESRSIFCSENEMEGSGIEEKLARLTKDLEGIC